jgi:hypothetical protein
MIAVSVVMGVYNAESTLAQTLDSVLSQQGCEFEFIVVDDGSTDGTPAVLHERAAGDSRLKIIRQENLGLTRALVAGCAAARGEFIARQDAGDLSWPDRLRKQAAALRADRHIAFVSGATRFVDSDGDLLYEVRGSGRAARPTRIIDPALPHAVVDGPSSHPSVMFRRTHYEAAGGYRPQFYYGQDWDLWYRLAQRGAFQMLDDVLVTVCWRWGDISMFQRSTQQAYARLSLECLRRRLRGEPEADLLAQAESLAHARPGAPVGPRQLAAAAYFLGECLRRNGSSGKAAAHFARALRQNPLHLKAAVRLLQAMVQGRIPGSARRGSAAPVQPR